MITLVAHGVIIVALDNRETSKKNGHMFKFCFFGKQIIQLNQKFKFTANMRVKGFHLLNHYHLKSSLYFIFQDTQNFHL